VGWSGERTLKVNEGNHLPQRGNQKFFENILISSLEEVRGDGFVRHL
jgi:hypothetical protein